MEVVLTKTTYLQMFTPPAAVIHCPRPDGQVSRLVAPSVEDYRRLYRGVGGELNWIDRLLMPADELRAILADDRVEVHVLQVAEESAGYCELDRRTAGQIELAYFGLLPKFVGQGLGKWFLNWTLQQAWSYQPDRVWVHTCDLDHPSALPNYLRAGFRIYDERMIEQFLPADS